MAKVFRDDEDVDAGIVAKEVKPDELEDCDDRPKNGEPEGDDPLKDVDFDGYEPSLEGEDDFLQQYDIGVDEVQESSLQQPSVSVGTVDPGVKAAEDASGRAFSEDECNLWRDEDLPKSKEELEAYIEPMGSLKGGSNELMPKWIKARLREVGVEEAADLPFLFEEDFIELGIPRGDAQKATKGTAFAVSRGSYPTMQNIDEEYAQHAIYMQELWDQESEDDAETRDSKEKHEVRMVHGQGDSEEMIASEARGSYDDRSIQGPRIGVPLGNPLAVFDKRNIPKDVSVKQVDEAFYTPDVEKLLLSLSGPLRVVHNVSPSEVKQHLASWTSAAEAEVSALEGMHAIKRYTGEEAKEMLRRSEVQVLPAKTVFTVKPGSGTDWYRRKCRVVGCGNFETKDPTADLYAGEIQIADALTKVLPVSQEFQLWLLIILVMMQLPEADAAEEDDEVHVNQGTDGIVEAAPPMPRFTGRYPLLVNAVNAEFDQALKEPVLALGAKTSRHFNSRQLLALLPLAAAPLAPRSRARRSLRIRLRATEADTKLDLTQVAERWSEAESVSNGQELAQVCALLCCVQRQLGTRPRTDEWDHEAEALLREAIAAALEEEEEGNEAKAKKKAPEAKCRKKAFEETAEEEELEVVPPLDLAGIKEVEAEGKATSALTEGELTQERVQGMFRPTPAISEWIESFCGRFHPEGYMAARHEGTVGVGRVVSQAPALPLVVSWEGPRGLDEGYGTSFAVNGDTTLLEHVLKCVEQASADRRFGVVAEEVVQDMKAKVSLLQNFTDISETPQDWSPGTHGLWYADDQKAKVVYLPQVAQEVVDITSSQNAVQRLAAIVRRRTGSTTEGDEDDEEEEEDADSLRMVDSICLAKQADLEAVAFSGTGRRLEELLTLPEGHCLYRFETVQGECPISTLPLLQTRKITDEHLRQLLIAKARISPGEDKGSRREGAAPRFAFLGKDDENVTAIVAPTQGSYANLESSFSQELVASPPAGLREVQRLFVLAPVWDCYIDGCGIPEQRCAWYGDMPLDIPLLELFRNSKAFQVLTVEQDQRERCVEALLPFVQSCVGEDQKFTLVPILVGGLMTEKAEEYASLLSPYVSDPRNLFVIGGDVDTLGEQFDWKRFSDMSGGPERFMTEVVPVFSALELFLSILAAAPEREQLRMTRYWSMCILAVVARVAAATSESILHAPKLPFLTVDTLAMIHRRTVLHRYLKTERGERGLRVGVPAFPGCWGAVVFFDLKAEFYQVLRQSRSLFRLFHQLKVPPSTLEELKTPLTNVTLLERAGVSKHKHALIADLFDGTYFKLSGGTALALTKRGWWDIAAGQLAALEAGIA
ncbi:Protein MEMO1 [Symbiodinium microadriaticum]|uniref:Protein MEMO1 n=1 Tax=Symbiodinium microadriaticum TaxID=2951 RepID=A0A1Q9CH32_SYMMI|nr:Protein MEMO1 [Symbiodinium microadriaticum]